MISDKSYRSDHIGNGNSTGQYITFTALPHPLPDVWIKELKNTKDYKNIVAVEQRAREAIGFRVTRKEFPPKGY
jgi:hypothetical protein